MRGKQQAHRSRLMGLAQSLQKEAAKLPSHFHSQFASNAQNAAKLFTSIPLAARASWDLSAWESWNVEVPSSLKTIRFGSLVHTQGGEAITLPAMVPFIGANQTYLIRSKNPEKGLQLLQSLVVRTAVLLPHQTKYTLLDPAGAGIAYPMRRLMPMVAENTPDIRRDLESVLANIQRVIESYLDASIRSFEEVPEEIRTNERYNFVFAANFPNQYDRRAIEALMQIGNTGPASGTYTFIHVNGNYELPRDLAYSGFKNAVIVDLDSEIRITKVGLTFSPDAAPSADVQSTILQKLRDAKPPERSLAWKDIVGIDRKNWWTYQSSKIISTPVGTKSATEALEIWFGENEENRPCVHGMLGAMPGSGKSNLFHVLITGLAVRYSPQELRFYLIDGKDGVEFNPYRNLPHAEVVSVSSSAELSRSVLTDLVTQKERRNAIFARAGVNNLDSYVKKGAPEGPLPRILLLIDEYQELFEGDKDGTASAQLLQIAAQGRSAGIHMILASQRFGAVGMMNQAAIFGNLHLLMAMQMRQDDIAALTQFGRRGKALIQSCDLPGKIVINDRGGDDAGNKFGKAAYIQTEERNQIISELSKAAQGLSPAQLPRRVVFDGKAQPIFTDNVFVSMLLNRSTYPTHEEMQALARRDVQDGGFGVTNWFPAQRPIIAWLGQQFNVRGQASVVLRRNMGDNILIVGNANAIRYASLAAAITSFALNGGPARTEFTIVDRSIVDSEWSTVLKTVIDQVLQPNGFVNSYTRDGRSVEGSLEILADEVVRRRALDETEITALPSHIVVMTELDTVDAMCRTTDTYGGMSNSRAGELLSKITREGPSVGVHVVLSFANVRALTKVLDERRGMDVYQHRVAFQMSEEESHTLVRSRRAAQLQSDGPVPICALYVDLEADQTTKFKPFSIEDESGSTVQFLGQLQHIGTTLGKR
jgi:S-DNA-T family DNA segregation ATPase FtsK/SpoIIIE